MPMTSQPVPRPELIIQTGRDPSWDAFVDGAPGGHHVQTSLWAEVKEVLGWHGVRVVLRGAGEIVGGCQLLVRDLGRLGRMAYVPRGPLLEGGQAADVERLISGLRQAARAERVLYLKLQPPSADVSFHDELMRSGFVRSGLAAGTSATVRVDLSRSPDDLLAAMRAGTRSNIRKARRRGVAVRVGQGPEIALFSRLLEDTARRQGFAAYPRRYYERMWSLFAEQDRARLLLAEVEGRTVSAILLIGYGDTVIYKMGAWSGERSNIHPNELLHWSAIEWAREEGYRYYDLEGIPHALAAALLAGETPPQAGQGTARFKLGFGGEVVLLPATYDYARPRPLNLVLRVAAPRLDRWRPLAARALGRRGA